MNILDNQSSSWVDSSSSSSNSSSNSSSSSSNQQKLILIVSEDKPSTVANGPATENRTYAWDWVITQNGKEIEKGTTVMQTAQWVGDKVTERPGISALRPVPVSNQGQSITLTFASKDQATGKWKANGWVLTAKQYEKIGITPDGLTAYANSDKIPPEAKPATEYNTMGMTEFLAKKLKQAQSPGWDHWYMLVE